MPVIVGVEQLLGNGEILFQEGPAVKTCGVEFGKWCEGVRARLDDGRCWPTAVLAESSYVTQCSRVLPEKLIMP